MCHRLISSWRTDLNVSLAALELLSGLARLFIRDTGKGFCHDKTFSSSSSKYILHCLLSILFYFFTLLVLGRLIGFVLCSFFPIPSILSFFFLCLFHFWLYLPLPRRYSFRIVSILLVAILCVYVIILMLLVNLALICFLFIVFHIYFIHFIKR